MKIFQIGFNRCGTKTIHAYLSANGVKGIHWDKGKLAQRIFANLEQGADLLAGYDDYQAFTDMEWLEPTRFLEAYKLFPEFAERYPDAVFIFNTRDREAWIKSRLGHGKGRYAALHKAYLGLDSDEDLAAHWRKEWDAHHRRAIAFFEGKPLRFFVCRIETDLPDLLNRMLPELDLKPAHYAVRAKTRSRLQRALKGIGGLLGGSRTAAKAAQPRRAGAASD